MGLEWSVLWEGLFWALLWNQTDRLSRINSDNWRSPTCWLLSSAKPTKLGMFLKSVCTSWNKLKWRQSDKVGCETFFHESHNVIGMYRAEYLFHWTRTRLELANIGENWTERRTEVIPRTKQEGKNSNNLTGAMPASCCVFLWVSDRARNS